jgi:hypothetical protein
VDHKVKKKKIGLRQVDVKNRRESFIPEGQWKSPFST